MDHCKAVGKQRKRRSYRVRKRTRGTTERPRLCVTRSHRNITAQVIDDLAGKTLASASTADKDLAKQVKYGGNRAAAEVIGKEIAERAVKAGVSQGLLRSWPQQVSRSSRGVGRSSAGRRFEVLIQRWPWLADYVHKRRSPIR